MRVIAAILVVASLTFVGSVRSEAADRVDELVDQLNQTSGLWLNGLYPIIELGADVAPSEVLAVAVRSVGFDGGKIQRYQIQETRKVEIKEGGSISAVYFALVISSDQGSKIFLCKPERNGRFWWSRFFEVKDETEKGPNQALQTTSVTPSGFGKVPVSDRQIRGV